MPKLKINLNYIYIIIIIFFIISVLFGHNSNSYLFNSNVEIIILNLLFLIGVINASKENVFLKFYLFYFFVFYILNIYLVSTSNYDSFFVKKYGQISDVSTSINILSLHFISLFMVIRFAFKSNQTIDKNKITSLNLNYLVSSVISLTFLSFFSLYLINYLNYNFSILRILSIILSIDKLLFISIIILFVFWKKLKLIPTVLLCVSISICIFYDFYNQSKSSFFFLLLTLSFIYFYFNTTNFLNLKLTSIAFLLLIISLCAYFFSLNTLVELKSRGDFINFFISFFNRIGFFEFFLDKNNQNYYQEVMSLEYNLKAFTDKITPGFDLYGIPLMKNSLHYLWHYYDGIQYSGTTSEQSTLFALSNRIFGYLFIVYYIVVILFFKFLYNHLTFLTNDKKIIFQFVVLYLFWVWLDGFGIDLFLMSLTYQFILMTIVFSLANIFKKIF